MKKIIFILLILTSKSSAQVINKMIEVGYSEEIIKAYEKTSKPTFIIQLNETEDYQQVGNSRIGGLPDLPVDIEYPTIQEDGLLKHYIFIAQINLSELPQGETSIFPKQGMLYFFIHNDEETMSKVAHKVIYSDIEGKALKKFELPSNIKYTGSSYEKPFSPQKISFRKEKSIDLHHLENNRQDILQSDPKYFEVFERTSRFGGHDYSVDCIIPAEIIQQLEILPYEETFFLTRGYLTGKKRYAESNQIHFDYYNKKIAEAQTKEEIANYQKSIKGMNDKIELEKKLLSKKEYYKDLLDKWELILAIDSIDECEMLWWDASILEFYINRDDLKNNDFKKTYCLINH